MSAKHLDRRFNRVVVSVMATLWISVCAYAQPSQGGISTPAGGSSIIDPAGNYSSGQETDHSYIIGPTNLLHVKILGEGGLQSTFRVDELGYITHPLAGRIPIGGLTVADAEARIEEALRGDYILNPHVTIFVLEHSRFSVLGEVRKPGNYEILGRMNIVEAISIAGGFTPVAAENKVRILRQTDSGEKTMIVNVEDIMEGKKEAEAYIQAGDVVHVTKSFF